MIGGLNLLAVALACALPFALFVSRFIVRRQRGAALNDLVRVLYPEHGADELPLLDIVRSKYATGEAKAPGGVSDTQREPRGLALTGLLFAFLSYLGFALLLTPKSALAGSGGWPLGLGVYDLLLWTGGPVLGGTAEASRSFAVASIATAAFLGAYVTAATSLIRQLLNYELGAISFLRSTFQLLLGVVVAVIGFRALSPLIGAVPQVVGLSKIAAGSEPTWWLGAAFMVGLAPEAGLSWIASQLKITLQKRTDIASLEAVCITPVEVIDGIDSVTRFRLEENNIIDVQGLATANPVELYVETPYGFLQVFDWVLQAQLCSVVGLKALLSLRKHHIRTIFDLERAVLPEDAPKHYVLAMGALLFAEAEEDFKEQLRAAGGSLDVDVIRHAVAIACDDLHVHRLRALWQQVLVRSGAPEARWLYRRGPLPGDQWTATPLEEAAWAIGRAERIAAEHREGMKDHEETRLGEAVQAGLAEALKLAPDLKGLLRKKLSGEAPSPLRRFANIPGVMSLVADDVGPSPKAEEPA